ncbi:T9SS type A sorting domain-containing protein, partial [Bacteroidota bacterium]
WNHYEGFQFGSYYLYRGTTIDGLTLLDTIPSSLNSYSDLDLPTGTGNVFYQIEVDRGFAVNLQVGNLKAEAGPYAHTVSNMEDNRLRSYENHVPTDIQISNNSIDENLSAGSQVGVLSTTDDDDNDKHTYTITSANSGDEFFEVDNETLISKVVFDYEVATEFNITIITTDSSDATFEKEMTIVIRDVYETSIDQDPISNFVDVYPNPANDIIYLKHNINDISDYVIYLINSTGQIVYYKEESSPEINISTDELDEGMYIIRLENDKYVINKRITIIK